MVRALLAGRKTQTRRVLRARPGMTIADATVDAGPAFGGIGRRLELPVDKLKVPFAVGDRLYVREAWATGSGPNGPQISFRATPDFFDIDAWDGPNEGVGPSFNYDHCPCAHFHHWLPDILSNDGPWRTPLHMPRWASRLTLTVTGVRVQRLQEITNEDCIAEGVDIHPNENAPRIGPVLDDFARKHGLISHYGAQYRDLWDHLNAARGFGWDANPWVIAVSFGVGRHNIDAHNPTSVATRRKPA
jgi:hypothetical protein